MKKNEIEKDFYGACSKILGVEIAYRESTPPTVRIDRQTGKEYTPATKATRWGGREPGNGRIPGCGLIRIFSTSCIKVDLYHPIKMSGIYTDMDEVLELLKKAIQENE